MLLTPYPICKGRKFKREKLKKLIRPISCKKKSVIFNYNLSEKNKIRFITQIFRWFRKDSKHYKVSFFLKKKYIISNLDIINVSVKIQKAGWKKLLLKLNYYLKDYKTLKRRSYSLNFKFFFINIEDKKNKEITLDIEANKFDIFDIFITTNSFYLEEFYNIINTSSRKILKEKKKDDNDLMLQDLDYVFSWTRSNQIICYDVYMPWYLTKENYIIHKKYKRRFERKYYCLIKEKKFNSIFPLKNVIGHLIVSDKKEYSRKLLYWKTLFQNDTFKKKDDLFKELKILVRRINKMYKINSVIVYFFISYLKE